MQLLQTLVDRGIIAESDRGRAADAIAAAPAYPPHQVLVDKGYVKETALLPDGRPSDNRYSGLDPDFNDSIRRPAREGQGLQP